MVMCQILSFLEVEYVLEENMTSLEIGKYALTYFVNQDVFSNKPTLLLYGKAIQQFPN